MKLLLDAVLPIFAIMLCGYLAGTCGLITKSGSKSLNNYVFYITLPALLFLATATAPIEQVTNWHFVSINLGGILASFIMAVLIGKYVFHYDTPTSSIYGMGASYGTTGYMGIPLVTAVFGTDAALPAALATLLHNILVITIVLVTFEASKINRKEPLMKQAWAIFQPVMKSPITISVSAGIVVAILGIDLPASVHTFTNLLANASGPTALFALGLGLVGQKNTMKNELRVSEVTAIVVLKIIFQPLVTFLLMMYVFEVDVLWGAIAVIMSALPVGAVTYIFAEKYGKLENVTSTAILLSMLLSTMTLCLLLLSFS
ncbi:AEC family transporter [Priestia taiwanensis]|uniref:Transporter YfdV n=1 Tax=Priestia taiwanensis TaxID=1347902 RepID=A0A917ETK6_9BACI|nr:AEC family transporter [Priestia taiwanensis]MBM7364753.1 putative permease [Priestia taiwanensis]GGE79342.1 hypothetical protein GCM10007140_31170 [Priestia taiwanensis]